jgi:hypothetical protein
MVVGSIRDFGTQFPVPARQHQGLEVVIRSVIASIIRAIVIMTKAVE